MVHFYGIYGLGAVVILLFSQYFQKNNITLFLGGYVIGSVTEYMVSFLTEIILGTKWWDYSDRILNIHGRVCLLYSIFWGILTILLVKRVNPLIDKIINKIKSKVSLKILKILVTAIILFLALDCIATCYAQNQFVIRMIVEHNIEVENQKAIIEEYERTYKNETLAKWIEIFWNDKKMIQTFPNIKIEDKNHKTIYLDSLLPDIQPYYKKIFEK